MESIKCKQDLRAVLAAFPDETMREYEIKSIDIMLHNNDINTEWLIELINTPIECSAEEEKIAFAAFCILCGLYRRFNDYTKYFDLLVRFENRFRHHIFYGHLKLLYYNETGVQNNLTEILKLAQENYNRMPFNIGVQHALASTVAWAFEETEFNPEEMPDQKWIRIGIEAVEKAISIDGNYAKFYLTKARLYSLRGNYDLALQFIKEAIDKEDSKKSDYPLRINKYLKYEQIFRSKRNLEKIELSIDKRIKHELDDQIESYIDRINEKQDELNTQTSEKISEIKNAQIRNLEFLGLFAGIISFTIGSIGIAAAMASVSFLGAAGLIIVLMGALLTVYSGFGIILHGIKMDKSRYIIALVFGLIFTAVGAFICWKL